MTLPAVPLNTEMPSTSMLPALRRAHEIFAASRRFAHVPRPIYMRRLDGYVASASASPLLLSAPSGAGKSALLAYWAYTFRTKHPEAWVVEHYIGCGEEGANWPDVVRRLMLEIRERFAVAAELPKTPEGLVRDLPAWLWYVRSPMILILDGLDQLSGHSEQGYRLPDTLPPQIRLIASTAARPSSLLPDGEGWDEMTLTPFTLAERRSLVRRFVHERKAGLTAAQQRLVVADVGSANPLLLRTRLEEARAAGTNRSVDEAISYYLGAATVEEMYGRLLQRLETELEPGTAQGVLSLLCMVKTGLTLDEMAAIASLPQEQVAAVVQRLEAYLLRVEDRFALFHVSLGRAAAERWPGASSTEMRLRLVRFFRAGPQSLRSIQEVLYQLTESGQWRSLAEVLTDMPTFLLCHEHLQYELFRCWQQIGSRCDMVREYARGIEGYAPTASAQELIQGMKSVGRLLEITGRVEGAEEMYDRARQVAVEIGDDGRQALLDVSLGNLAADRGDYAKAAELLEQGLEILRRTGDGRGTANVMSDLARVIYFRGDFLRARELFQAGLEQAEGEGNAKEATRILGNLGAVFVGLGELGKGLECFRKMRAYAEQAGDIMLETAAVNNAGVVAARVGNLEEAFLLYERSRQLAAAVGDKVQLATAYGNLGNLLMGMHRPQEALEQCEMQKELGELLNDQRQVAAAWSSIGKARMKLGLYALAVEALQKGLETYQHIGDLYGIGSVLGGFGHLHLRRGEFEQGVGSFLGQKNAGEQIGNQEFLMESALGIGRLRLEEGNLAGAEECCELLARTAREVGNSRRLVEAEGWLAVVAGRRGKVAAALQGLDSAVARSRKEYPTEDVALWLLEKVELLMKRWMTDRKGEEKRGRKASLQDAELTLQRVADMTVCRNDQKLQERVADLSAQLKALRQG